MNENKVALVTGVSSGIGREIAQLLAERGARVFGTVRDHRSTAGSAGVELIHMDVTKDSSVAEAVQSVLLRAGEIHALVNNAGYALLGGLEETSLSEAQQQFDTNFFGVLRVTQAVLPSMRRLGYGRIVNISSILGLLPGPYMGIYARQQTRAGGLHRDAGSRGQDIRHPGCAGGTRFYETKTALSTLDAYADQRKRVEKVFQQEIARGDEPRAVAEIVCRVLTVPSPRLRYPVGKSVVLSRLRRSVVNRLIRPAGLSPAWLPVSPAHTHAQSLGYFSCQRSSQAARSLRASPASRRS
jgi:NAD(P)-dependent dehydrogenase (short-subunit alcohol dehydrogenase family)